jgi:isocitrate lyase
MEFVKVERDELIQQFKDYIDLLKKCPKDMEFHTLVEFCGINKDFLKLAKQYNDVKMSELARIQRQQEKKEGNI